MRILNEESVWPALLACILWKVDGECCITDLYGAGRSVGI